jgi:flagellar biosynthesis protein FlhF
MKIKRYTAASMRSALDQVRAEQGPDAVILSSRRIPEGIEVVAAVDYDETLMNYARAQRPTAPQPPAPEAPVRTAVVRAAAMPAAATPAAAIPAAAIPAPSAVKAAAAPVSPAPAASSATIALPAAEASALSKRSDNGVIAMRRDLQDMRQMLESSLANLGWKDRRVHDPLRVRVLEELSALDIAPDVATRLAELAPTSTRLRDPAHIPTALLAKHLPITADPTCTEGGIVAIVGPTGAGKTTTIAKLAARWAIQHGVESLAIISTDAYRIGAREQLSTYARILGVPMYAANSGKELAQVLDRLKQRRLVLIDTAGVGPRAQHLPEQLSLLRVGAAGARILLALPAPGEARALDEITLSFKPLAPVACVLTKIDEAGTLGAAMSTAIRHSLPIAYLCNGQRVPEDLHGAQQRRIWLVRMAMRLRARAPVQRDESYLARHFGRSEAHA